MKSRARTIGAAAALLLFAGTRGALAQPVPTTVDGSIGAAKNAVGAFHQPSAVLCDLNTLAKQNWIAFS